MRLQNGSTGSSILENAIASLSESDFANQSEQSNNEPIEGLFDYQPKASTPTLDKRGEANQGEQNG